MTDERPSARSGAGDGPIRVLVVDDAVAVRRLMTMLFQSEPDLELAGLAQDGLVALEKIELLRPDIISLDLAMPNMDGLTMLREMRARGIDVPVIMFSTLTRHGAKETIEGLALGAADYVTKPTQYDNPMDALEAVRAELVPRITAIVGAARGLTRSTGRAPGGSTTGRPTATTADDGAAGGADGADGAPRPRVDAVVIGSSTGGPNALAEVIGRLPGDLRVPVLVAQHMPPVYTTYLAQRLDGLGSLPVREAVDGETVEAGTVYLAPGDHHLTLRPTPSGVTVALTQPPPVNHCRPAVDVLFSSAARVWGRHTLAVVLTGMGHDGRDGCAELRALGGQVLVQDEPTSVVWGMPGAVHEAGLADEVLPIDEVAAAVVRLTGFGSGLRRSPSAAASG